METLKKFNNSQRVLLQLLAHSLFSVPFEPRADTDWAEVLRESKLQAVSLVAFKDYKELPIAPETAEEIQKMVRVCTMANIRCFQNHAYLHSLMSKADIPYCIIKGVASAHYYPEPLLRNMGDVDFYVHPENIKRATEVFINDGFERTDVNHICHVVLKKKHIHCEMHFDLVGLPEGEVGARIGEFKKDICESSYPAFDEFASYRGPSAFHHGLIMLMHLQHHLLSEGIGLRHLCDWAVFANSFTEEEFAEMFEEKLKKVGLWNLAKLLGLASSEYIGMPYKNWMGNDKETASALIEDIIAGGNFGRKDPKRSHEGMFISDRGKDGVKRNRILQLFKSLNKIVKSHWQIAEKLPIIYPVGWVYFSLRYLIRVLFGKRRSIDIVDAYKQSGKRKEFYSKLRLYEPEK